MSNDGDHQELASALKAVIQDRNKADAEDRAARAQRRGAHARAQWPHIVFVVAGLVAMGWIWTVRPAFIFGPGTQPPRSPEAREAKLRLSLYLTHARVRNYIASTGRVPMSLAEGGRIEEGVSLDAAGGEWRVHGTTDGITLVLTHRMDADSFLGNAVQTLREHQ
jgi:hypothetical protein